MGSQGCSLHTSEVPVLAPTVPVHVWGGAFRDFHGPFLLRTNLKEGN